MLKIYIIFLFLFISVKSQDDPWDTLVPEILAAIKPPTFRDVNYTITDYGAIPNDCGIDNTLAISWAIRNASESGGGRVIIPPGVFITGAIYLHSNVNLHLALGATLRFTWDLTKYPNVLSRWEGIELMNYSPFIYAYNESNLAITGRGTLDGNCDCSSNGWWPWKGRGVTNHVKPCGWNVGDPHQENDRNRLFQMAEDDVPVHERIFGLGHYLRPSFTQPYLSKNILLEGVRILDSPMWIVHPVLCENILIQDITISSHGPNSDGVDPESCKNVLVQNVHFDCGDDDVAVKSGRNADGRRINVPSENIIVRNSSMKEGHGGATIGSCISGGVKNIFFENLRMDSPNLNTAIRFKNNAMRGGLLENIYYRNIEVGRVAKSAIEIDYFYEEGPDGDFTPIIRNLDMRQVHVRGGAERAIYIRGYDSFADGGSILEGIRLVDSSFEGVALDSVMENINSMEVRNTKVNGESIDFSIEVKNSGGSVMSKSRFIIWALCLWIFKFRI